MRVSVEAGLPVPAGQAWDVLLDWERQSEWMKDADSVKVLSPGREGVGVVLAVKTRVLNVLVFTERLEVVVWEPPRRLVMAHRSFVRGAGEWVLEPAGDGCRFRWTEELSLPMGWPGELALKVYRPMMRYLMRSALDGLREMLEARRPQVRPSDST